MAIQKILYLGDPVLRQKSAPIKRVDDDIKRLAEDLIETMVDAPGLGLSAVQIGEPVRLIVVRVPEADDTDDEEGEGAPAEDEPEGQTVSVAQTYRASTADAPAADAAGGESSSDDAAGDDGEEDEVVEEFEVVVLANPRILRRSKEQIEHIEGCLSLPTLHGLVSRADEIVVRGRTMDGVDVEIEASGMLARIFQHEIDHLDGVVFLDRADPDSLYWTIPDEEEDRGYREDPTTCEQAIERFERLYRRKLEREAAAQR